MFPRRLEFALKLCVSLTLLARGWLTWRWDSPIRGLIWKEDWWSGILEQQTNLTWNEFAMISDPGITNLLAGLGFEFADIRRFELDAVEDEYRFVAEFEVDRDAFLLEDLHRVLDG